MTIGARIRECRTKIGMTQEELARKMYIDKRTVSAYENDKIDIKASILRELGPIIGTTAGYLIDGEISKENINLMQLAILLEGMDSKLKRVAVDQVRVLSKIDKY